MARVNLYLGKLLENADRSGSWRRGGKATVFPVLHFPEGPRLTGQNSRRYSGIFPIPHFTRDPPRGTSRSGSYHDTSYPCRKAYGHRRWKLVTKSKKSL
eukprot:2419945-Rhodomonas_salina.2